MPLLHVGGLSILIRSALCGASVLLHRRFEVASQVATRPPGADPSPASDLAAGLQPLPAVDIRDVDERAVDVGNGTEGEIQVRGPIVMRGYLDDPEATARAMHEGSLATGDIGRLDARGRLRMLDRPALASVCREKLAGDKDPIGFIERASLPRTASGKLQRRELAIRTSARLVRDPLR